jgi:hypothetical protein
MFYIFLIHKYLSTFVIERELAIPERPVYVLSDYIRYVYDLFFHVSENVPLIMLLYGSFLTILFLQFPRKRQGVFSLIISFVSILLPVGFFIITLRQDFGSKSLLRYMTLGHFLLPFTYMYVEDDRESKFTNTLSFLAMVFISLILIMFVWVLYGINIKWKVNEGTYSVPLMKYAQIAEKAKASVGVGEDILLVDSLGGEPSKLANMDVPGIFLRYYLDEYSVGKQYSLPVGQFEKYLNDFVNPDYLLILEYDGYFNGCNVLLSQGGSYLVPYELDIELFNEDICPFDRNEIINLGE